MISPLDSRVLDINSESLGIEVDELMANAGEALADVITDLCSGKRILFVCGTGNNGGDGYVAARLLEADVAFFMEPKTIAAMNAFRKIEKHSALRYYVQIGILHAEFHGEPSAF